MQFVYKRILGLIIVSFFIALPFLSGQERTVKKSERNKELIQKLQRKYYKKARKKTIKHRREIQTQATQKRMKETDRKARKYNRAKRANWLEKHFSCKKAKR
jgi:DNA repair exonuclease SbcCD nuclease subunit